MSVVDISNVDLVVLIKALWNNMKPAAFFTMSGIPSPSGPSEQEVLDHLKRDKYIDYLNGRCIKTDFSDLTKVSTRMYNRDAGEGAFEKIVNQLRN